MKLNAENKKTTMETKTETMVETAFSKSYWCHNGKYQAVGDKLRKMIPDSGPVTALKSKALEKYRKACNCYYDLFNNGLWNRAAEFRSVFGFSPKKMFSKFGSNGRRGIDFENEVMNQRLNTALDEIISAAAIEQWGSLMADAA